VSSKTLLRLSVVSTKRTNRFLGATTVPPAIVMSFCMIYTMLISSREKTVYTCLTKYAKYANIKVTFFINCPQEGIVNIQKTSALISVGIIGFLIGVIVPMGIYAFSSYPRNTKKPTIFENSSRIVITTADAVKEKR